MTVDKNTLAMLTVLAAASKPLTVEEIAEGVKAMSEEEKLDILARHQEYDPDT